MRTILVEASPLDPGTAAVVPVRLAGGGSKPYRWLGFNDWRAGIVDLPRFTTRLDFGDAGWTGGAIPQTAALEFMSADVDLVSNLGELYWRNVALTVKVGDDEAAVPTFALLLSATVAAAEAVDGKLTLTIGDLSVALNKPLAPDVFQGVGGLEGAESARGRVKRRSFGQLFNVEGFILDPANLIYEFGDPSKPLTVIDRVRDRGREGPITVLAWQGSAAATFNALKAAVTPQGGGVAAPSIACVKWWTTAAGPLTADFGGELYAGVPGTAPDIANLIAGFAGVTVANLDAARAARGDIVGLHCADSGETIAAALDRLLIGSSLLWVLNPDGTIRLEIWSFDESIGSAEPVEVISSAVARRTFFAPIKGRKLGFQPNSRVMSAGEVSAAIRADETFYPDGTKVSDRQPAQAGADKTSENTAANTDKVGDKTATQVVSGVNSALNGLQSDGTVKANRVPTIAIVPGSVTVPASANAADLTIGAGQTVEIFLSDWIAVGDSAGGGALVTASAQLDSGTTVDVAGRMNLYIDSDNGAGFVLLGTGAFGARTNGGGDTYIRGLISAQAAVTGTSRIRIKIDVASEAMPGGSTKSFILRSPGLEIFGGKR